MQLDRIVPAYRLLPYLHPVRDEATIRDLQRIIVYAIFESYSHSPRLMSIANAPAFETDLWRPTPPPPPRVNVLTPRFAFAIPLFWYVEEEDEEGPRMLLYPVRVETRDIGVNTEGLYVMVTDRQPRLRMPDIPLAPVRGFDRPVSPFTVEILGTPLEESSPVAAEPDVVAGPSGSMEYRHMRNDNVSSVIPYLDDIVGLERRYRHIRCVPLHWFCLRIVSSLGFFLCV